MQHGAIAIKQSQLLTFKLKRYDARLHSNIVSEHKSEKQHFQAKHMTPVHRCT